MIEHLLQQRQTMITYLLTKVENSDWHGVADAAMDLREIEVQIKLLKELEK
jgi:predicted cupin superfamily sugar epimerase